MSDSIQVNEDAASKAAGSYAQKAASANASKQTVDDAKNLLSGWEGDAAAKAKETMDELVSRLTAVTDNLNVHGEQIGDALRAFKEADESAAKSYGAALTPPKPSTPYVSPTSTVGMSGLESVR